MCKIALCLFYVLNYSIGKGVEDRHYDSTRTSTKTLDWFLFCLFVCRFTSAWQYFPTVKNTIQRGRLRKLSTNFCFICLSVGFFSHSQKYNSTSTKAFDLFLFYLFVCWILFPCTVKNTTQRGRLRKLSINFFQFRCFTSSWEYLAHHYWWSKDCI